MGGYVTVYALILISWYTLESEPEGSWQYQQTFGWFKTIGECEERAKEELKAGAAYQTYFKDPITNLLGFRVVEPRKMPMVKMTHVCKSLEEMNEGLIE